MAPASSPTSPSVVYAEPILLNQDLLRAWKERHRQKDRHRAVRFRQAILVLASFAVGITLLWGTIAR